MDAPLRVVVCGPPGAGKSRWVASQRQVGDVVWDWDAVAKVIAAAPVFPRAPEVTDCIMFLRASLLHWLTTDVGLTVRAFVIVADAEDAEVIANAIGAEVVDLGLTLA